MHEPSADAPTGALIDHIQTRYHEVHRRELPDLIWLAGQVEALHATDPNTPHGLTQALEMMIAELDAHMREEEEIVFPALRTGGAAHAVGGVRAPGAAVSTGRGSAAASARERPSRSVRTTRSGPSPAASTR